MFLSTDGSVSKRENKIHYLMIAHVKYLPHILVLAGGLALAGCGGNSTTPGTGGGGSQITPTAAQISALRTAATNATEMATELVGSFTDKQLADAKKYRDALVTAIATAREQGVDVTQAQTSLAAVNTAITAADADRQETKNTATAASAKTLFQVLTGATYRRNGIDNNTPTTISVLSDTVSVTGATSTSITGLKKTDKAVATLAGWSGAEYKKGTDHLLLYGNRGETEDGVRLSGLAQLSNYNNLLGLADTIVEATANVAKIKADRFDETGLVEHTEDDGDKISIPGTYDGYSGTYRCEQSDNHCTSLKTATGITLDGDWVFVSTNPNEEKKAMETNYLTFGWWAVESNSGNNKGDITNVKVFVDSEGESDNPKANSVATANGITTGSAIYKGGAAGKYAVHNLLGNTPATSAGAFTADAELTANFKGTNTRVDGKIINFMSDGQKMNGWEVTLHARDGKDGTKDEANASDGDGIGRASGETSHTTWKIGNNDSESNGSWSGDFYQANDERSTAHGATVVPGIVAGTFDASYRRGAAGHVGQMVGAFGAEHSE